MNSRSFHIAISLALAIIVALTAAALSYVVTRSSVTDARSAYKGSDERFAVLRQCIREPRSQPCDRPEVAGNIARVSWQAFATVDYLADILFTVIVLLASSAVVCAYLSFAFWRNRN